MTQALQGSAKTLGWFSIGLGTAELLAPRMVARICGIKGSPLLIRLYGVREIATGLGIFSQGKFPASAMWMRVGGDAMDLASLGAAFLSRGSKRSRLIFALGNVLAVTAFDVVTAMRLSQKKKSDKAGEGSDDRTI